MSDESKEPAKEPTGAGEGKTGAASPPAEPKPEPKAEPSTDAGKAAPSKEAKGTEPKGEPKPFELKLPEGSLLESGAAERIASYAKERGLSQAQAQELLEREHDAVASFAEGQKTAFEKEKTSWLENLKSDKELGGEGFGKNVELAKRIVQRFATEEFRKTLDKTGLGNHPELVRVFVRIGKAMSEDTFVRGGHAPAKKPIEEVFYGDKTQ